MTATPSSTLNALLPDWQALLQGWALDGSLASAVQEALMLEGTPDALQDLITQWSAGEFSALPPIVLLSSAEMNGAMGAYAISTGTIYLNADWLAGASKEQVYAVLTEELGHHLDAVLNPTDTPGDEGETFSKLLIDGQLSAADAQRLGSENDQIPITIAGQEVQAETATGPIIRGNSLYTLVSGGSWDNAQSQSAALGGYLAAITSSEENDFVFQNFVFQPSLQAGDYTYERWIGASDTVTEGTFTWSSGELFSYENFASFYDPNDTTEQVQDWVLYYGNQGFWDTQESTGFPNPPIGRQGIAEISLNLFIARTGAVKEGTGVFTTSINLTAGSQTSGNLVEGATVYWSISGITADDLEAGSDGLTGTGVITNGKLDIQHSLKVDADTGEQFTVTVYSDSARTQQIGSSNAAAVQESTPVIRGNSLYTVVSGGSWTNAQSQSAELGGYLAAITSSQENDFVFQNFVFQSSLQPGDYTYERWIGASDSVTEGAFTWSSGESFSYQNFASFYSPNDPTEQIQDWVLYYGNQGFWDTQQSSGFPNPPNGRQGIAEIPIISSITRPGAVKEGAGLITTSINLTAGSQTSGNLVEGATVYWSISGITADDLEAGSDGLTGTGVITNGKLDIQHSLKVDADTGEQFTVTVYSDSARTQQIGTADSPTVEESDTTPPTVTGITVQGTTVILKFSEAVTATSVPLNAFAVATVDSRNRATNRTISSVALDQNDSTRVILTLSGTAPASNVNLRVSYTDPATNQSTGVVQDEAGNDLASFTNVFATTYITSATSTIASQYQNLILTGSSAINGTGNTLSNTITGNSANNTLSGLAGIDTIKGEGGNDTIIGGAAADILTGGAGTDTFRYALADSLLGTSTNPGYDRITDFVIGTDRIDGPSSVTAANLRELGTVSALTQAGISAVLTSSTFVRNGAATFTFGSGDNERTFLALNNGTAGFSASTDAIVEITGYSGSLNNLAIV